MYAHISAQAAVLYPLQDLIALRGQGPHLCFAMRIVAALAKGTPAFLPPAETVSAGGMFMAYALLTL